MVGRMEGYVQQEARTEWMGNESIDLFPPSPLFVFYIGLRL